MIVNSLGDWVVYGLGLMGLLYGAARLLPDIVVACVLGLYRANRKLHIGFEHAERELPYAKEKPQVVPLTEKPAHTLLQMETGSLNLACERQVSTHP